MANPVFAIAPTGIPSRNLWKVVHVPSSLHLCVVQGKRFANRAVAWLHSHQAIVDAVAKVAAAGADPDPHALRVAQWASDVLVEASTGRAGGDKWNAAAKGLVLRAIDAGLLLDSKGRQALHDRKYAAPPVPPAPPAGSGARSWPPRGACWGGGRPSRWRRWSSAGAM
jgi:hypothetical protein